MFVDRVMTATSQQLVGYFLQQFCLSNLPVLTTKNSSYEREGKLKNNLIQNCKFQI
jgi:hypothetical protein